MAAETNRVSNALSFLFGSWRIRPKGRRVLYLVSVFLALTGAGMLSYPYFTHIVFQKEQSKLATEFRSPEFKLAFESGNLQPGRVLTRIVIPSIAVDALVVQGTDAGALRSGAGHYSETALPCDIGNVAIAGHRTTYGKPFNRLDELSIGDEITLITPEKRCTYRVVDGPPKTTRPHAGAPSWITHPNDGGVLSEGPGAFLTLTTCHPKGSAAKRLILRAEKISG